MMRSDGGTGRRAGATRIGVAAALVAALLLVAGCSGDTGDGADTGPVVAPAPGSSEAAAAQPGTQTGLVTNVVDGDTIDVAGVGRIRVVGIDTPERGACGYESATNAMIVLVLGKEATLVPGAADDADRYGRLLRYVDVGDVDAGLRLIEDGWAIARYDSRDGYGRHAREDQYVAADLASPDLGCYPDNEP